MKIALAIAASMAVATARDIHVGKDAPTIFHAIKAAQPGDTIHLEPKVYRDYAGFYGKKGEPGKPDPLTPRPRTTSRATPVRHPQKQFPIRQAFSDSNMMPILCTVTDSRYRATGYGVLNLFSWVVGGLKIYAGGVLRDAQVDASHVFQFAAASMLVCAFLLFSIRPTVPAER